MQSSAKQISELQAKLAATEQELADFKSKSVSTVCNSLGTKTDALVVILLLIAVVLAGLLVRANQKCEQVEKELAQHKGKV